MKNLKLKNKNRNSLGQIKNENLNRTHPNDSEFLIRFSLNYPRPGNYIPFFCRIGRPSLRALVVCGISAGVGIDYRWIGPRRRCYFDWGLKSGNYNVILPVKHLWRICLCLVMMIPINILGIDIRDELRLRSYEQSRY
jgi:hypothetical protein